MHIGVAFQNKITKKYLNRFFTHFPLNVVNRIF